MRTREEQISDLVGLCEDAGILAPGAAQGRAEDILNEAEERVRAQIARDSERLDWLSEAAKTGMRIIASEEEGGGIILDDDCMGDVTAPTLRDAIDAARESNND